MLPVPHRKPRSAPAIRERRRADGCAVLSATCARRAGRAGAHGLALVQLPQHARRLQLQRVALARELLRCALARGVVQLAELLDQRVAPAPQVALLDRGLAAATGAAARCWKRRRANSAPMTRPATSTTSAGIQSISLGIRPSARRSLRARRRARARLTPSPRSRARSRPASRRPARARAAGRARARASDADGGNASATAEGVVTGAGRSGSSAAPRRRAPAQRPGHHQHAGEQAGQRRQPDEPVDAAQRRLQAHELAVRALEVGEHLLLVVARRRAARGPGPSC